MHKEIKRALVLASLAALPAFNVFALNRVAVLPFTTDSTRDASEGWSVAVKLAAQLKSGIFVQVVDQEALKRLLDEGGAGSRSLGDLETLKEIGRLLDVDAVVTGTFAADGDKNVVKAVMIEVVSGKMRKAPQWRIGRDVQVAVPEFDVEPPVLDQDEALAMRDSVSDFTCDGAHGHVDSLEKSILDLKARYWALQLRRGVNMASLKFNPGSTISDPTLKKEFYGRMKAWSGQEVVPELTPSEIKQFGEIDEKSIVLARRCGIL